MSSVSCTSVRRTYLGNNREFQRRERSRTGCQEGKPKLTGYIFAFSVVNVSQTSQMSSTIRAVKQKRDEKGKTRLQVAVPEIQEVSFFVAKGL